MSQADALALATGRPVSRETINRLTIYAEFLKAGAASQNLVSASTLDTLWDRHILDSAQLVQFAPSPGSSWADVGSGAGLPGIVIAILMDGPVTLIEPRKLRADFLGETVKALGLTDRVSVEGRKVERVQGKFDLITGRAVAPLDRFLGITQHLSRPETIWALPKGRNAETELVEARRNWQCDSRVEPSCTDPDSRILVLTRVGKRKR